MFSIQSRMPPVLHVSDFCPDPQGVFSELFEYSWRQESLQKPYAPKGTMIPEPRKVMWFAPKGHVYTYAGKKNVPLKMTQLLVDLKELAEKEIEEKLDRKVTFNSVFCNLYENGDNYIGWHADDEPGISSDIIASISFGATRDFLLRENASGKKWYWALGGGDLVVMYDNCQKDYKHSVPKRKKVQEPRINLTYRVYEHSSQN